MASLFGSLSIGWLLGGFLCLVNSYCVKFNYYKDIESSHSAHVLRNKLLMNYLEMVFLKMIKKKLFRLHKIDSKVAFIKAQFLHHSAVDFSLFLYFSPSLSLSLSVFPKFCDHFDLKYVS